MMNKILKTGGFALLIAFSSILIAGCRISNKEPEKGNGIVENNVQKEEIIANEEHASGEGSSNLMDAIDDARAVEKQVQLSIEPIIINEEKVKAKIILHNAQEAKITSVRSFIAYNPDVLIGLSIEIPEDSPFELIAPGENKYDSFMGIAKIGLSATEPVSLKEIEIATLDFKRQSKRFTTLDFFDVQDNGHTEVLGLFREQVKNLLTPPKTPGFIIESDRKK